MPKVTQQRGKELGFEAGLLPAQALHHRRVLHHHLIVLSPHTALCGLLLSALEARGGSQGAGGRPARSARKWRAVPHPLRLLSAATFSLLLPQLSTPKENADLLHPNALCVTGTLFLLVSALSCVRRGKALLGLTLEGLDALERRVEPSQGRLSPGSSYSGASPTLGDVPRPSCGRHPARTECPQSISVTSLRLDKARVAQ